MYNCELEAELKDVREQCKTYSAEAEAGALAILVCARNFKVGGGENKVYTSENYGWGSYRGGILSIMARKTLPI